MKDTSNSFQYRNIHRMQLSLTMSAMDVDQCPGGQTSQTSSPPAILRCNNLKCENCQRLSDFDNTCPKRDNKNNKKSIRVISKARNFASKDCLNSQIISSASKARCAANVVRWDRWLSRFLVLLVILSISSINQSIGIRGADGAGNPSTTGVCQTIDIRNDINEFSRLKGCRVVEGWVQILLLDKTNTSSFANITFPDLVEITGYLLLYKVNGLRSIGHLFPNLTVIRGETLLQNHALVGFEMPHLQEIGLHSLAHITRGSVRFERNSQLCYANNVDWDLIAKYGKDENVITANKPINECPVCEKHCPVDPTDHEERLCWNKQNCQKICIKCGENACNASGDCCHPLCLGGCTGPTDRDCVVCRHVTVDNRCLASCPAGTYEFRSRRCIKKQECQMMKRPKELSTLKDYPYKAFGNQCIIDCPLGYEEIEQNGEYSCKLCNGPCFKECSASAVVDSIAKAQALRGCSLINGNLEIEIKSGKNIVNELEENLSGIQVITGYLKIFRNYAIVSLNFLRNLTEIRGEHLAMKEYTLVVLDNQNLQDLWNWTTHKPIKLGSIHGQPKVSFHYNPKLCLRKIEEFRRKTGLPEFTEFEVSSTSNGDKVPCDVSKIRTYVHTTSDTAVLIKWEPFEHHDIRTILGYVFYYKEAPYQNVSIYDGRDACGGDGWIVQDVATSESEHRKNYYTSVDNNEKPNFTIPLILTGLKPFTQYAYYVKTYTISTERSGGESDIGYFTTAPGQPSIVRGLVIYSNASDTLVISWMPPDQPNSNLTHYTIIGRLEPYDLEYLSQRNYCDEPLLHIEHKSTSVMVEEEKKRAEEEKKKLAQKLVTDSQGTCECQKNKPVVPSEKDVHNSIAFEDALHNQVYIKRQNRNRRDVKSSMMLRSVPEKGELYTFIESKDYNGPTKISNISLVKDEKQKNKTVDKMENGKYIYFERMVPSTSLNYVMRDLRHFGKYNIKVMACRDKLANVFHPQYCSPENSRSVQTLRRERADDVPSNTFKLKTTMANDTRIVKVFWDKPPDPNGIIVTYQIEYKRVDVQNHKTSIACTTAQQFEKEGHSYTLPNLPAGNYSIKIQAVSFAGNGNYTETKYFFIPKSPSETHWNYVIGCLAIVAMGLVAVAMSCFFYRKKFMRNVPSMRLIATVNPEYVASIYVPDEWEIQRKNIQLIRELGNGSFGMVYEGIAKDIVKGQPETPCAIKTVNENATDRERIEFLNEASVMKAFDTHHVVKLLGVVSQGQPSYVVMELMVNGDLKTYLRNHRPDATENCQELPPTLKRILQMAIEIADGMAYLSAKKFVHRDLAARNCMVSENLTVKIGDFGMTRDIYETDYYRKGTKGLLPVRWMAPESLKDGVFTSFSDVWSYGIVLWEMVTLASQPYQGLSNDQVLRYVIEGGIMERPENCPDSMYTLMRQTWHHKATRRPTFLDIENMLMPEIDEVAFEKVSFYHSSEGMEARNQNNSNFLRNDKDLELVALQEVREEENENEVEEDSPLSQDFGDFSMVPFSETPKAKLNFLNLDSSKAPLKAGFEDFDGVSGSSVTSSKGTLELPFAEEELNSIKASPFVSKKSSRGNLSHISTDPSSTTGTPSAVGRSSISPQSTGRLIFSKDEPNYENRSPQAYALKDNKREHRSLSRLGLPMITNNEDKKDTVTLTVTTSSPELIRSLSPSNNESDQKQKSPEFVVVRTEQQPPTLNNGYIGGAST